MKTTLWTVWCNYFATGEGITYAAIIGYATSAKTAKKLFQDKFGEYLTIGCEAKKGIVRNKLTEFLFSKALLDNVDRNNGSGAIFAYGEYHLNKS